MKPVTEQFMNAQCKDPNLFKDKNNDQTIILPCRDPKVEDVHGCALNVINSKDLNIQEKFKRNLNQDSIKSYKCNNSYPNTIKPSHPFSLDETCSSKESPHFECAKQSLKYGNKNCRWGGCHGPMKTKCLVDPDKGHMFMNGCQVWHCGGCCKMECDHLAYESMILLQQSNVALEKKKLQIEGLRQPKQEQEGESY